MTVPIVVSTVPADGATDIGIASQLVVTFNTPVKSATVTSGTVVVYRLDTFQVIPGTYSVNGAIVTFRPSKNLYENTSYGIGVMGVDTNNPGGEVKSVDTNDSVQTTARYQFRTETEQYATMDQVQQRADITYDGPLRTDMLAEPGGLSVMGVIPRGYSSENSVDMDTVTFSFSEEIDPATVIRDVSIFFDVHPALGMEEYYAAPTGVGGEPILQMFGCTGVNYSQPTGTFMVTGSKIIWTRGDHEPEFNYNSELQFTLTQSILDVNGQSLLGDTDILMSTEYFPKYLDARIIRLECGSLLADKNDDTINRMILKNSIEALDEAAWCFDAYAPTPAVRKWVRNKTIIDLHDMISAYASAHAGLRKELADLRIEYPWQLRLDTGLRAVAVDNLAKLTRELRWYRGDNRVQVASIGEFTRDRELERSRVWDIDYSPASIFYGMCSPKVPAHNLDKMRLTKLQLSGTLIADNRYVYGTTTEGTGLFAYTCPT